MIELDNLAAINGELTPVILAGAEPETRARVDDLVTEFAALRAKVARLQEENDGLCFAIGITARTTENLFRNSFAKLDELRGMLLEISRQVGARG